MAVKGKSTGSKERAGATPNGQAETVDPMTAPVDPVADGSEVRESVEPSALTSSGDGLLSGWRKWVAVSAAAVLILVIAGMGVVALAQNRDLRASLAKTQRQLGQSEKQLAGLSQRSPVASTVNASIQDLEALVEQVRENGEEADADLAKKLKLVRDCLPEIQRELESMEGSVYVYDVGDTDVYVSASAQVSSHCKKLLKASY